jgi:hypothetical protein
MVICDFGTFTAGDARITSATVSWEDRAYPDQELIFEIHDGERRSSRQDEEPCADAFLSACFPLAAVHGEARVRIEGKPCPMLIEGLYTAHAWWTSWGGMPSPTPLIETTTRGHRETPMCPRRGVSFLWGGSMACTR